MNLQTLASTDKFNMQKHPDVSIIIANYNYARFIGDALESILAQTLQNWECIIIDDASTDDSVKIITEYTNRDKRFRLIQQPKHMGVSAARNRGLDTARGEYIAFLDSDDCFTEYALEMLLHLARSTNADMVGGGAQMVPEQFHFIPTKNTTWTVSMTGGISKPSLFLMAPTAHKWCWLWRRIYKRSFIAQTRFQPCFTTFGDDLTFMLEICYRAQLMVETNNVSVYHRTHPNAITTSEFDPHYFDWFPTYFKYIRENLLDKYDTNFWRSFFQNSFYYLMVETISKPKKYNKYQYQAKQAFIASCREISPRYLTFKQRILRWFMLCLK